MKTYIYTISCIFILNISHMTFGSEQGTSSSSQAGNEFKNPIVLNEILNRLGQHTADTESIHSAIIKLPDLPENIVPIILRYAPVPVTYLVDNFEQGTKIVALFKGAPGTGKTSLAYALAKAIGIPITHIQASGVITPLQGSGEKTLDHDLLPIINAKQRHIVLIDEMDQIFGYGDEKKARSVMLHLNGLIGMSHPNIMYIGTTNKYELIDPALRTHLTNCIEIPYPSPEYRKAIIRALLPEGNDPQYVCQQGLRDDGVLNPFVARLDKISIRELISIVSRAKECALSRHPNPMTLEQRYLQRVAQEQAAVGTNGSNTGTGEPNRPIEQRVELRQPDLYAGLNAYQTEIGTQQQAQNAPGIWAKLLSIADRALPYVSFITQYVHAAYSEHRQSEQFKATQAQAALSHTLAKAQMAQNELQFNAGQALQKYHAQRQLQQQQDQFAWQQHFQLDQAARQQRVAWTNVGLQAAGLGLQGVEIDMQSKTGLNNQ